MIAAKDWVVENILYSSSIGTIVATFFAIYIIVDNEIDRIQVYSGSRQYNSIRKVIFPSKRRVTLPFPKYIQQIFVWLIQLVDRLYRLLLPTLTAIMPGSRGTSPSIGRRGISPFGNKNTRSGSRTRTRSGSNSRSRGVSPAAALVRGISPFRHHHGHSNSRNRSRSHSFGSTASERSEQTEGSHPGHSSSQRGRKGKQNTGDLPPPVLVYHENARSIVFRDHLRRASSILSNDDSETNVNDSFDKKQKEGSEEANGVGDVGEQNLVDNNDVAVQGNNTIDCGDKAIQEAGKESLVDGSQHHQQQQEEGDVDMDFTQDDTEAKSSGHDDNDEDEFEEFDNDKEYDNDNGSGDGGNWGGNELSDMANIFFPDNDMLHLGDTNIQIAGYQPNIVPLRELELGPNDEFEPLLESPIPDNASSNDSIPEDWTEAEKEVYNMLQNQMAVVKTIKNSEWTSFLQRFKVPHNPRSTKYPDEHDDIPAHATSNDNDGDGSDGNDVDPAAFPFNSFVTSTSLLPSCGKKMRSYGAPTVYSTGVVFALPTKHCLRSTTDAAVKEETEDEASKRTHTWSWPSGYSAKTEFNIDGRGNLINGRQEALVSLSKIREYNDDYITKQDYVVAGRVIQGGLKTVPYNEIFVRVGGLSRIVAEKDCASNKERIDGNGTGRSFDKGVGLPVALFVRTITFGHLISLFRTRARLVHVLGERHISGIPLLYISPDSGVRVLTESLQRDLLRIAARNLNPFQNPMVAHKTTIDDNDRRYMNTKLEELIDLDESIRHTLTPEECARLAGGFGATDESIAQILKEAMIEDKRADEEKKLQEASGDSTGTDKKGNASGGDSHRLQDIVNEGLASAVRSGDYYASRQLLILYTLVASEGHKMDQNKEEGEHEATNPDFISSAEGQNGEESEYADKGTKPLESYAMILKRDGLTDLSSNNLPPPPPPPPLDTDRLRSATNSDGLLAVLGAAQVLKAMRDGSARKRTDECVLAVEE